MIQFANAKINIGLQVLSRRTDGYHNLETVFYPVPLYDVVEITLSEKLEFIPSGLAVPGRPEDNLCLQAYDSLKADFSLPQVQIYLHKTIPVGAGLGGGSADATAVLKALNQEFSLGLSDDALEEYAAELGADCAFFVRNQPVFATGIGTDFEEIALNLSGYELLLVKPDIHISTAEAYATVRPDPAGRNLRDAIGEPPETWRQLISNDFEAGIFSRYPVLSDLKQAFYDLGAVYAAMSGSGSALYGLFDGKIPAEAEQTLGNLYSSLSQFQLKL